MNWYLIDNIWIIKIFFFSRFLDATWETISISNLTTHQKDNIVVMMSQPDPVLGTSPQSLKMPLVPRKMLPLTISHQPQQMPVNQVMCHTAHSACGASLNQVRHYQNLPSANTSFSKEHVPANLWHSVTVLHWLLWLTTLILMRFIQQRIGLWRRSVTAAVAAVVLPVMMVWMEGHPLRCLCVACVKKGR